MRISAGVQTCALPIFGPGEIFGSVAIFTDHLYPADGIAMVGSTEASWTRADWLGLIERYPRIALNLIAIVGRRLAELQDRVREMATQRAERRIANTLLRLARQAGRATGAGTEIGFPLRRKRSEEHTSELQSLMRTSYAVFCLKNKKDQK